jgi:uncharacterized membrane protein YheB (UPF0754 family)
MHPAITISISATVGAAIGAITNELAIRWIFRYIMPRKKGDMALAIREVLSGNLMSPERLRTKFQEEKFRQVLNDNIRHFLDSLANRDLPSPRAMLPENAAGALEHLLATLPAEEIRDFINHDNFQSELLQPFLTRLIEEALKSSPRELLPETIDSALSQLPTTIGKMLEAPPVREKLAGIATDLLYAPLTSSEPLKSLLPAEAGELIHSAIKECVPHLRGSLEALLKDEKVQRKLSVFIRNSVKAHFKSKPEDSLLGRGKKLIIDGAMGFFDIDAEIDEFCRELPERIQAEMKPGHPAFQQFTDDLANTLLESPPHALLAIRGREHLQSTLAGLLQQLPTDTLGTAIANILKDALSRAANAEVKTLLRFTGASGFGADTINNIAVKIKKILLSEETGKVIASGCRDFAVRFIDRPIGRPEKLLTKQVRTDMTDLLEVVLIDILSERLEDFTRNSGIWDTVVDSIINLDDKELELMARRIANRELRWVTVLGGIIGFIIGLMQGGLSIYLNMKK